MIDDIKAEQQGLLALPTRVILPAWGEAYVQELLAITLPALLAPGNLPYVAGKVPCEVVLVTEERLFGKVRSAESAHRIRQICPLRLIAVDDLVVEQMSYGLALTFALHRGFSDLGAAMTDAWMMFLNSDFILADGCLRTVLDRLQAGSRLVAAPSYCVNSSKALPLLLDRLDPENGVLSVPSRKMAEIVVEHRHNTVRAKTANDRSTHLRHLDQCYWLVDDRTLIAHQMPIAIVGMRPERAMAAPNAYWDHGLIHEFCPTAKPDIIGDSDDFLMLELRDDDYSKEFIAPGWPNTQAFGKDMVRWVTDYQREFSHYALTVHADELPPGIGDARRALSAYFESVLSFAPSFLPSHIDHPQWTYHYWRFIQRRHEYLSTRLGSQTESPPPPDLPEVDKAWWRADGLRKRHKREREALIEVTKRQLGLLEAIFANATKEVDDEFIDAAPVHQSGLSSPSDFPTHVVLNHRQAPPSGSDDIQPLSDDWMAALECHETAYVSLMTDRELIDRVAKALEERCEARLASLDRTFERLIATQQAAYSRLLGHTKSAAVPLVTIRQPSDAPLDAAGGSSGKLLGYYYRLFGRVPRVTNFSPLWAPLREIVKAVDDAILSGMRDVLLINTDGSLIEAVADGIPGMHASVSIEGVKTGNLAKAFEHAPEFDLSICDLLVFELGELDQIYDAVRPFIRPSGWFIGFRFNGELTARERLPPIPLESALEPGDRMSVRYTGSPASAKVVASWEASHAAIQRRRSPLLRDIVAGAALAVHTPRAWIANRLEAGKPRPGLPDPYTSMTIVVQRAAIEDDDGSLQFAQDSGIHVEGLEAPVFADRVVSDRVALRPETLVILTLGQSNAANEGQGHYTPRGPVHVFNVFDRKCYAAVDPLPGATGPGASVWGRLGDKLIDAGVCRSVLLIPIAVGASYLREWLPGNAHYRRLALALDRIRAAGISVDLVCWHQGEAEANHTGQSAAEYQARFRLMLSLMRMAGMNAPIYVAVATRCEHGEHPCDNHAAIRSAQMGLVSAELGILAGPDTDQIGDEDRVDGCHFAERGLDRHADLWLRALTAKPPAPWDGWLTRLQKQNREVPAIDNEQSRTVTVNLAGKPE